jgi:hypothetical protein
MKKLLMLVVTLMLGTSLALAQGTSGSTDKTTTTASSAKKTDKTAKAKKAKKPAKASTQKKADTSPK